MNIYSGPPPTQCSSSYIISTLIPRLPKPLEGAQCSLHLRQDILQSRRTMIMPPEGAVVAGQQRMIDNLTIIMYETREMDRFAYPENCRHRHERWDLLANMSSAIWQRATERNIHTKQVQIETETSRAKPNHRAVVTCASCGSPRIPTPLASVECYKALISRTALTPTSGRMELSIKDKAHLKKGGFMLY